MVGTPGKEPEAAGLVRFLHGGPAPQEAGPGECGQVGGRAHMCPRLALPSPLRSEPETSTRVSERARWKRRKPVSCPSVRVERSSCSFL